MRRNPSSLHLFLTLLLMVGLLFGAFGQTLVNALGEKNAPAWIMSFKRQNPASSPTNADTLTFRVTFSGNVSGVDPADFVVHDNTPSPTTNAAGLTVTPVTNSIYDVNIHGGNLDLFNGVVGLDFSPTAIIKMTTGKRILIKEPPIDETYLVDNTNPIVTIDQGNLQLDPALTQPVVFTVVFDEVIDVATFTPDDITQGGTAPSPEWSIVDSGDHKSFTLSVVASGNGTINPLITAERVNDLAGNGNDPFIKGCDNLSPDNCVTLEDDTPPSVTITQAATQSDPATGQPVIFTVEFSEVINTATFTKEDITQSGTSRISNWGITDTGDHKTFRLAAWASGNGLIMPTIVANAVFDLIGYGNSVFLGGCSIVTPDADNCVVLDDNIRPDVTIEQDPKQKDPANNFPIKFNVKFTEIINAGSFTTDDILDIGTAGKITWNIINSGNNKDFTLFVMASTPGTLIPVIQAGKITDLVGNQNRISTSVDNSVTYRPAATTPTATAIPYKTVVITEVAWMGSAASSSDEWIELYNNTKFLINLDGWELRSFRYNGKDFSLNLDIKFTADDFIEPRTSTDPKDTSGYFLLERGFSSTDNNAVMNIDANKIYTNFLLSDSGEILLLCSRQNITEGSCNINQKRKVVDFVNGSLTGSGGINPWPAGKGSPIYGSMERKNLISDDNEFWFTHPLLSPRYGHDRNWDGTSPGENIITGTPKHPNWAFEVTATPRATVTPTRTPTRRPGAVPILVINEVLARAGSDWNNDGKVDVYDEFIEVMNAGTVNVNLNNYKLDDELNLGSAPYALPNQTLKPGEMTVFYGSQTGIHLEDSGDTVRLIRSSNNAVVDAISYSLVKTVDSSICRYTDGYGSWINGCFPTPGRPNALVGDRYPSTSSGSPIPVCFLPDSVPEEFVLAECGEDGLGIWNNSYWDSFPGEGKEIWLVDDNDKWPVVYQ